MTRIDLLKQNIKLQKDEAILVSSVVNRQYLSSFKSSSGLLFITQNKSYLAVDFRYFEKAKKSVDFLDVILLEDKKKFLNDISVANNIKSVYLEEKYSSLYDANIFTNIFTKNGIKTIKDKTLDCAIEALRQIKSGSEIQNIRKAQKITDLAFTKALKVLHEGLTEKELAFEIEFIMRKNGASCVSFDLITIFGENTSLPHGEPTDRALQPGDLITMDIGALYNNYCSDMTRTVAFKSCTDEQKNVYNTVLNAQKKALNALKANVKCAQIDKIARDFIYDNGFKGCFGHSTGHSLGLEIHETPALSTKDDTLLKPGMIVTIEPGIYLENKFGVRIEDMALITENGYENLTQSDKNLIIVD